MNNDKPASQKLAMVSTLAELEALYGGPPGAAIVKESDRITPQYRRLIEASPFLAMATVGPDGLDCTQRGDKGACVAVVDERTLALPDRRGNNRIDSLRNIVRDPRVALLFLIPGSGTTFRVNGRAGLCVDPTMLNSFAVDSKRPRCIVLITVETCYFQCARAIVRSDLWLEKARVDPATLPSAGQMLASLSEGKLGGDAYDAGWPSRAWTTLW